MGCSLIECLLKMGWAAGVVGALRDAGLWSAQLTSVAADASSAACVAHARDDGMVVSVACTAVGMPAYRCRFTVQVVLPKRMRGAGRLVATELGP